eukprot:CAMPEP_0185032972 /NCGR_PEP_ID=MMETSP1103-20130426/21540_1 /TAXON_ID=36769 /ORGANISM="Paraphysomonas bandaiensis, Strain Caron Lab Isolate" /LENGTH=629 /DNA_ID=CAMNT_0027569077 /DNA_START=373 /DNA_END=2262 /DNA_ORIENTATION=-
MDIAAFSKNIESNVIRGTAGESSTAALSMAGGTSPTQPLYVRTVNNNSFWDSLKSMAISGIKFFVVVSFLMVLFDDKSNGGGISKLTGMNSIVHVAEKSDKSFDDVVGVDEAKEDLQEIVMYLKEPKKFTKLGGKLPKGVLLTGPPGTGKTLLAKAIAGEAGVPFFYTSGSEFEEMFVGVGARRVRDLFQQANSQSPCIIFIDEIDAIGGSRHLKDQSAMKMTLNQLLVEMDGFQQNSGTIVIAATNFPESLDSALTRPGRLDKHVDVSLPDVGGRKAILELYGSKVPLSKDVDLEQIARGTPGFSGAELYNLVNQAALKASRDGLSAIGMASLEYAKDKIMMGAERQSAVISKETMKTTAFHEAGHALVSLLTDGADPIHKATIMPRGRALGMVMQLPDGDQTSLSRKQMLAKLDICMGGRVAEELIFGEDNVTSGASSDFQQATRLAKMMITKWGFSSKLGIQYMDDKDKFSGDTQTIVDQEVRKLLEESYNRAKTLLETHRKELGLIANALLEHETLSGSEVVDISKGKPLNLRLRSQKASREATPIPPSKRPKAEKDKPKSSPVTVQNSIAPPSSSSSSSSSTNQQQQAPSSTSQDSPSSTSSSTSASANQQSGSNPIRGPPVGK